MIYEAFLSETEAEAKDSLQQTSDTSSIALPSYLSYKVICGSSPECLSQAWPRKHSPSFVPSRAEREREAPRLAALRIQGFRSSVIGAASLLLRRSAFLWPQSISDVLVSSSLDFRRSAEILNFLPYPATRYNNNLQTQHQAYILSNHRIAQHLLDHSITEEPPTNILSSDKQIRRL